MFVYVWSPGRLAFLEGDQLFEDVGTNALVNTAAYSHPPVLYATFDTDVKILGQTYSPPGCALDVRVATQAG